MWLELNSAWRACWEQVWEACSAGSLPIGAVICDPYGRIVARGRNRILETHSSAPYLCNNPLAHAEMNALLELDYQRYPQRADFTLYTSTEPCPLCMGALYMSGVKGLCYAARDPFAGSVNLLGSTPYLAHKPIRVHYLGEAALESIIAALYISRRYQWLGRKEAANDKALQAYAHNQPRAYQLGQQLWQHNSLRRWQRQQRPAEEVFGALHELLADLPDKAEPLEPNA